MENKILLFGGSGLLGNEFKKYITCIAPSHKELDITKKIYYDDNINCVINCAAYTDVAKAEVEINKCFKINVEGTYNLIKRFSNSYFVYISTEYVNDPINWYSKTKLMGEEMVQRFSNNYLIIRTLFKARPFPYEYAFFDQYTNGDYVDVIAPMIVSHIMMHTTGIINIGTGKKTMFELARQTRPNIKAISVDDIKNVKLTKGGYVS